jgi:hypothetical protein
MPYLRRYLPFKLRSRPVGPWTPTTSHVSCSKKRMPQRGESVDSVTLDKISTELQASNWSTGEIAWKKDRPIGTAHATPLLVEHHSRMDVLVPGKHRLTAFDAKTHDQLWVNGEGEGPYNGEIIVSLVVGDGVVFTQLWRQRPGH